jgi:hypothetical protein
MAAGGHGGGGGGFQGGGGGGFHAGGFQGYRAGGFAGRGYGERFHGHRHAAFYGPYGYYDDGYGDDDCYWRGRRWVCSY